MGEIKTYFELPIGGFHLTVTSSVVIQWIIMALIIIAVLALTGKFKTIPKGSQILVETIVEKINGLVKDNMGEKYIKFAPYIGSIAIFLLLMNLTGLVGVAPPTTDISVTATLAIMTFVLVHATAIRKNGLKHYSEIYVHPYAWMLPLNIMERLVILLSLSLRIFGNITAGLIMVDLLYEGLAHISPFLQILIPVPFHAYFDVFDGAIQMFIFIMLTMIYTKTTVEH